MFCPKCGKELNDDAAFCGGCGSQLKGDQESAVSASQASASKAANSTSPSAANTVKATANVVGAAAKANPKIFIGIGAAVVVVIIAIVLAVMLMTGGFTGGQTSATFRKAFEEQNAYQGSMPAATYSKDPTYRLTSCNVTDIQKKNDSWVTAAIDAVAENDIYKVSVHYAADYYIYPNASRGSNGSQGEYQFEFLSKEVEAKSGILKDEAHGLNDPEAELSEDGRKCTVATDEVTSLWFADSNVASVYTYSLSDIGWDYSGEDVTHLVTYKDADGAYAARTGDMLELSSFAISEMNAETGSFAMQIAVPEKPSDYNTRLAANATLQATIDPNRNSDYKQEDGYSYYFEAKGKSTAGLGAASVSGYFTVGEDGSSTIQITSGKIDTTTNHRIGSATNSSFSFKGTLFKQ